MCIRDSLGADQGDISSLCHRIGSFNSGNQAAGFYHTKSFHHCSFPPCITTLILFQLGQQFFDIAMGAGNHMGSDNFAQTGSSGAASLDSSLYRADIAADLSLIHI